MCVYVCLLAYLLVAMYRKFCNCNHVNCLREFMSWLLFSYTCNLPHLLRSSDKLRWGSRKEKELPIFCALGFLLVLLLKFFFMFDCLKHMWKHLFDRLKHMWNHLWQVLYDFSQSFIKVECGYGSCGWLTAHEFSLLILLWTGCF